jgi:hypothetical protein
VLLLAVWGTGVWASVVAFAWVLCRAAACDDSIDAEVVSARGLDS